MATFDPDSLERLAQFLGAVQRAAVEHRVSISSGYVKVQDSNATGSIHVRIGTARRNCGWGNNGR